MRELKIEKYKGSLLLKFAVLCFAGFILVSLVGQQLQIGEKREELALFAGAAQHPDSPQRGNPGIPWRTTAAWRNTPSARPAASWDYAKPGERVFVDVGGGS